MEKRQYLNFFFPCYQISKPNIFCLDENSPGSVEYDKRFDPTSRSAQLLVLHVCDKASDYDNDMKIIDDDTDDATVKCYQKDFELWLFDNYPDEFQPEGARYATLLREFVNSKDNFEKYNEAIGFVDNRLSFVSVTFNSSQTFDVSYEKGFSHRDAWWGKYSFLSFLFIDFLSFFQIFLLFFIL